jgi:hypothetical protein
MLLTFFITIGTYVSYDLTKQVTNAFSQENVLPVYIVNLPKA